MTTDIKIPAVLAAEIAEHLRRVNARGHDEADRLVAIIHFLENKSRSRTR